MQRFCILVTRDHSGKIVSLYSPDFCMELLELDASQDISQTYRSYLNTTLNSILSTRELYNTPKKLNELEHITITNQQHWEQFAIDIKIKSGFFSKLLPILGDISNILSILTGGFITFMALQVASSNSKEGNDSPKTALSFIGAAFEALIAIIMYKNSNAGKILTNIGHTFDRLTYMKPQQDYQPIPNELENRTPNAVQSIDYLATIITLCIIINVLIMSIRQYQENILLVDKYLDLDTSMSVADRDRNYELIKWIIIDLFALTMAYSGLAFQGSFAKKLVEKIRYNQNTNMDSSQILILHQYVNTTPSNIRVAASEETTNWQRPEFLV